MIFFLRRLFITGAPKIHHKVKGAGTADTGVSNPEMGDMEVQCGMHGGQGVFYKHGSTDICILRVVELLFGVIRVVQASGFGIQRKPAAAVAMVARDDMP
jgi:hypothetical protein